MLGIFAKNKYPHGKVLEGAKALAVIKDWKEELGETKNRLVNFEQLSSMVATRRAELARDLPDTAEAVVEAKKAFRSAKKPALKAQRARRLILATQLHKYQRESQQLLDSTVDRVQAAIEDTQMVASLINNRVKDAEIYYQLNGQIKLVGQALAAATTQHALPEVEYRDYEYSMEQFEAQLDVKSDDEMVHKAQALLAEKVK